MEKTSIKRQESVVLHKNTDLPGSKYLVFTSAGDRANLQNWLKGRRNFDLWVTYYGDKPDHHREVGDYYMARKGAKFPNLHYAYRNFGEVLNQYEAVFVMDDDLIIDASSISRLFEIRKEYDLWLLQPADDPRGKNSHPMNIVKPFSFMRYVNFVEVKAPLFRRDKLDDFMKIYDPVLIGWGVDSWYMNTLGEEARGRVAVVDVIPCINPHDESKGGKREIDLLQAAAERQRIWNKIRAQYDLKRFNSASHVAYETVKIPLRIGYLISSVKFWLILLPARVKKKLSRMKMFGGKKIAKKT